MLNPITIYRKRDRIVPRLRQAGQRCMAACGLPVTDSDRRLFRWHNCHAGQRAFVIGNGPSLQISDLAELDGEITFASNKIYLAFDDVAWRPTYYSVSDVLVARNNREAIESLPLCKVFGSSVCAELPNHEGIVWLRELGSTWQRFSTNCAVGVYGGYSVVYYQLQLAFHMGIREVYLLGMDFSFTLSGATGQTCVHGPMLRSNGEVNHFHPDYRKPGETWTLPRLDMQRKAFRCARRAFEDHGGVICNASRRSQLDVFERVDFDVLLMQQKGHAA